MELTVLGWSQQQIASDLGISQPAVSKLLRRVEERVLTELRPLVERQKVRHTLRLEHLFGEAMRAWADSKADTTKRKQRRTQGQPGGDAATVAEITTESQHGDPRYLDEARKLLADHRKLWGLDAPAKLDLRTSRNPYNDMTEDALREEIARQNQLLTSPPVPAEPAAVGTVETPAEGDGDAHDA